MIYQSYRYVKAKKSKSCVNKSKEYPKAAANNGESTRVVQRRMRPGRGSEGTIQM